MTAGFPELVLGGVLVAPFATYAVLAGLAVALLRPLLHAAGFERAFANPPLTLLGIFVMVLAALVTQV